MSKLSRYSTARQHDGRSRHGRIVGRYHPGDIELVTKATEAKVDFLLSFLLGDFDEGFLNR